MKGVGKRRMAREMALQMLYQFDMGGEPTLAELFRTFDRAEYLAARQRATEEAAPADGERSERAERADRKPAAGEGRKREVDDAFLYARDLVTGAVEYREEIDALISRQADNWRIERMPAVDRNILRLAVFELLYEEDIPKLVVVDEAIELAKKFSTDQSSRFVNGLLDGLLKRRQFPGRMT